MENMKSLLDLAWADHPNRVEINSTLGERKRMMKKKLFSGINLFFCEGRVLRFRKDLICSLLQIGQSCSGRKAWAFWSTHILLVAAQMGQNDSLRQDDERLGHSTRLLRSVGATGCEAGYAGKR
jgi:hypothetical protein